MNKDKIHTLIKDYILNKISKEELIQFLDGFSEEEIQTEYEIVLRTHFDQIFEKNQSVEIPELRIKAREITEVSVFRKIIRSTYIYKVAASIAVLCCVYFGIQKWSESGKPSIEVAAVESLNTFVPKGEKKNVQLEDGTLVRINSDSKLSYPKEFDSKSRNVSLIGEAFFEVKRDENRPFTINTSAFDVMVLGTSFNVEVHEEDHLAAVSVESGKVRVTLPNSEEAYELTKNEKLILDLNSGEVSLQDINAELALKWTKGILYFDKTPLTEVEKSLERWYNIEIDIKDNSLKNKKLSGQHSNETLEEVLETLAYLLEFKYEIDGDKVTIKK